MADHIYELDPKNTPDSAKGRYVVSSAGLPVQERRGEGTKARDGKLLAFDSADQAAEAAERAKQNFPDAEVVDTGG